MSKYTQDDSYQHDAHDLHHDITPSLRAPLDHDGRLSRALDVLKPYTPPSRVRITPPATFDVPVYHDTTGQMRLLI